MSEILGIDTDNYAVQKIKNTGGGGVETESKTVKSTTTQQIVNPTTGKLIDKVIVSPIDLTTTSDMYTENGTYYISKGVFDGISQAEVIVNVPQSTGGDGSVVLDKVKYYDSYQDKQQALSSELLNIGDIGIIIEGKNEVVIEDNQYQNYLAFKFEEQVELNDIGGDPNSASSQGNIFEPINNNNAYFGEVSITNLFDMTQYGDDGVLTIDYTYNNENYTLTAKYTYDDQTDYVKRKSVEVKNSNDEVVSSVDKNGYIFLPCKFRAGNDFWEMDMRWFFYGGLCKGMYGQMGNLSIYDGQSWASVCQ